MNYDGNDLGYEYGYETELSRPKSPTEQNFPSNQKSFAYHAMGEPQKVADAPRPTSSIFIQDEGDPKKKGDEGFLGINKEGKVQKFGSEKEAEAAGASKVKVELIGKNDKKGTYLVQYLDANDKPIKYDEVDKKTAKDVLKFTPTDFEKADKTLITEKSRFAEAYKGQVALQGVEKNKSPKNTDLYVDEKSAVSPADIEASKKKSAWEGPNGSVYRRLSEDYGFKDTDIKLYQEQYSGVSTEELLGKADTPGSGVFPKLTDAEKADGKKSAEKREKVEKAASQAVIQKQGETLQTKLNTIYLQPGEPGYLSLDDAVAGVTKEYAEKKKKATPDEIATEAKKRQNEKNNTGKQRVEGQAGYVSKEDATAMVEERYRVPGGVDINKAPTFSNVAAQKKGVSDWIDKEVPAGPKDGVNDPLVKNTYHNAMVYEKNKAVDDLAPYMPGKPGEKVPNPKPSDTQRANARLYVTDMADRESFNTPGKIKQWRENTMKGLKQPDGKDNPDGVKLFKEKTDQWNAGFKGPEGEKRKAELAVKAGTEEPLDQVVEQIIKDTPKAKRDEVKAQIQREKASLALQQEYKDKEYQRARADKLKDDETQHARGKEMAKFQMDLQEGKAKEDHKRAIEMANINMFNGILTNMFQTAFQSMYQLTQMHNQALSQSLHAAVANTTPKPWDIVAGMQQKGRTA